ncbi:RagB/SusD family nutrient uptake outer membrane protein [termite gut metagenome]|uniref:RagB/SusD family nutrient uptake outer membrane protein n=1 Tax=termite gut metagenome TaxID=433724 RepID=A0A5J4RTD4_9ZZZZ
MKKIVIILTILLAGCNGDFIELVPISTATVEVVYNTDKDFQDAVIGCYDVLQTQYRTFWQFDLASDDVSHQWATEDIRLRMDNYTYQNNEGLFLNSWIRYYLIIFRANTVIEKIQNKDVAVVKNKELHIAEAKFLRAFAYFDLIRIFGDVPLVTKVISDDEAHELGRENVSKVYDFIITDLLDAANNLPDSYSGTDVGRATKGAAKSLLGRVYLTKRDFVNAESQLKEVTTMKYSLLPNYNDLWEYSKGEHHSEYIFDIEYEEGIEEGNSFTNEFLPQDAAVAKFYNVSGAAGNSNTPSDGIFLIFDDNDLRKDVSVARGFTDNDGNYIPLSGAVGAKSFTKKYLTPIARGGDGPANWKVIRYADVLLMLAEALNENNKTTEALNYLNQVRERVGMTKYSGLTQTDAREKIYLERRLELSFEGHRWFDLVRTGRSLDALGALGMKAHMVLFPIPLDQIQIMNNPTIFPQNPGWN